jgi:epoxyqueuosine reductase QueG
MILDAFEDYTRSLDIFKVGYTEIAIENMKSEIKFSNIIILAIEMDEEIIKTEPSELAKDLNKSFYAKFRTITEKIAEYLVNRGFETQIAYPNEILIDLPFLAEKAGLGCIGKNGLLITPEFGSKIKLSAILTSLQDPAFGCSKKGFSWIKEYCKECNECLNFCENEALVKESDIDTVKLIDSKCIGSEEGCTYCIEKCPFYEKGYLVIKNELNNSNSHFSMK